MSRQDDTTRVKVWDLPIRLFHWTLVVLVSVAWVSGQWGKLDLHMLLGTWIVALLLFRWVWGLVGTSTARFTQFVRGPGAILAYLAAARSGTVRSIGHNPLGALSVLALLGLLTVQAVTGLFTSDDIFSEGPLAHLVSGKLVSQLSTIHRIGGKVLLALVAVHLAAVIFYTLVKKDDLVPAMITGLKKVPKGIEGNSGTHPLLGLIVLAGSAAIVWAVLALYGN